MGVGHCLGDLKRPQCHVVLWFQEKDPFQDDCVVIDDVLGAMPPCSRFSWSAMLWPRTKTDQKGGSQSPNFEPTAKTTSSANHRKSPFRPPGQKAWQTCPRCATATPCLAKPRALGTNAASPEARPDATSALKQGVSNRNNRRNIYVNQIGKVLCRRNTTYLLTLFMDLVASLQLLWVILSCVYGTWCSSKTRWWF